MRRLTRASVPFHVSPRLCALCAAYGVIGIVAINLPAAAAGAVQIEQDSATSIKVVADGATISEVVAKLSSTYGFQVVHKGSAKPADVARDEQLSVDGQFEGSLATVLGRLLAKESYFIEHKAGSKSGISRVVLYNVGLSPAAGSVHAVTRPAPLAPSVVLEPSRAAAAQIVPVKPAVTPGVVPPVRRVQPVQPPAAFRSTGSAPGVVPPQPTASRSLAVSTPVPEAGASSIGAAAAGATPAQSAPLRKRGGVIQ
jgi:hypothetical protein